MGAAAELITLQLGSFANYVGAHFWNLQDEAIACTTRPEWASVASTLNSEVVCMWSEDRFGETRYCPRTVAVDLSGSLGGVTFSHDASELAAAAASAAQAGVWAGGVEMHHLGQAAKSRFRQQLEAAGQDDIDEGDAEAQEAAQQALEAAASELHSEQHSPQHWTDFLQVDLQHESVLMLAGAWSGQAGWDGWGPSGSSSSAARDLMEAAVDRVRWWAEHCDSIQGLQVLADDLGGWGGICHSVLQELRDEYPAQPLLYFSLQQQTAAAQHAAAGASPQDSKRATRWLLSNALSLAEAPQLASLYVPMSAALHAAAAAPALGHAQPDTAAAKFRSAAVLAAAIDTLTLPLRCSQARSAVGAAQGATDLHSLIHLLSGPAANLAAVTLQLPTGGVQPGGTQPGSVQPVGGLRLDCRGSSLTPGVSLAADCCLAESLTLRGAWRGAAPAMLEPTTAARQALDTLLLQRQAVAVDARCVVHACVSPMPVAAPLSFPASLAPPCTAAAALASNSSSAGSPGGGASAPPTPSSGADPGARPYLPRSTRAAAVLAPGALSRLTASRGFERVLRAAAADLQRLAGCAAGRASLADWGYEAGSSDVAELRERLCEAAERYAHELD